MTMKKIAIVTGGSSGIGRCAANALLSSACTVYELSRRETTSNTETIHITCDVTDPVAVKRAVDGVVEREGKVDILVCSAGFGISGAVEFTELANAKRQLDVNLFGTNNTVVAVLPHMRKAGGGRIVCISSVAAVVPIPFQTWYSVSKSAINAYVEATRIEVAPYGVSMCAVMPGDIKTEFTAVRNKSAAGDDEYGGRIEQSVAKMEKDERAGMSPEIAGAYIAKLALKKRVKPIYAIGFSYKAVAVLVKILPSRLKNFVISKLYG